MKRIMLSCLTLTFIILNALTIGATMSHADTTRYLRYEYNGEIAYGILRDDQIIEELSGSYFYSPVSTGKTVPLTDVNILTPVTPSKVIAVGLNYKSHLGERAAAANPGLFTKFPSSLIAHEEYIVQPKDAGNLHYEGEMVIVIGKFAKKVSKETALDYVFGVTIGNDVSERAWQRSDLQWFRAKGSDTFGPIGPYIVSGLDIGNLDLETRVNGEVRQSSSTELLIFDIPTVINYITQYITLEPGDVIYSGTPGNTKGMNAGDVVEVSLSGVGVLRNTVVLEE